MRHRVRHIWNASLILLVFCGIIISVSRTIADPDLWGHILWGQDLFRSGQFQQTESYSYLTGGQRWIDHAWLADVLIDQTWQHGGTTGLLLLKLVTWIVTLGLVFFQLARNGAGLLRAGILLFLGMPLLAQSWPTVRPQMFTALFYTLSLLTIWQAENGRYRWLWALPPLFLVWANLHGSFLAVLGLVGLWGLAHLLTHRNANVWRQALPPLLLSALVPLINPYGLDLLRFLIQQLGEARPEISEWRPMQLNSLQGLVYLGWVSLSILGIIYSRRSKPPALLLLLAASAALPWLSIRHQMLFGLTALVIGGPFIAAAWARFMPAAESPRRLPLWAALVPALAGLFLLAIRPPNLREIPFSAKLTYPVNAVAILQESGVSGNLAVFFDWGNYAAWHLHPQIKVSNDTRERFAFPQAAYSANLHFYYGSGDWASLLDDYPTDLALMPLGSPADNLLRLHPDWELIAQDDISVLYARRGTSQAAALRLAAQNHLPAAGPRAFP